MRSSFISWLAGGVIAVAGVAGAQDQASLEAQVQEGMVAAPAASDAAHSQRRLLAPRDPMAPVAPEPNAVKARPIQGVMPTELPPLPEGVEELKFGEMFRTPISDRGLELTDKLQTLHGKRVRVLGHMVYESVTDCNSCVGAVAATPPPGVKKRRIGVPALSSCVVPGRLLLAPGMIMLNHAHYGLADDLPPQTIFVRVPDKRFETVPFTPGPMLLTGVLQVGNQQEPDGRISVVRLVLDPPPAPAAEASPSQAPAVSSSAVHGSAVLPSAR